MDGTGKHLSLARKLLHLELPLLVAEQTLLNQKKQQKNNTMASPNIWCPSLEPGLRWGPDQVARTSVWVWLGSGPEGGDKSDTQPSVAISLNPSVRAERTPKTSFSSWWLNFEVVFAHLSPLDLWGMQFVVECSSGLEACRGIRTGPNRPSVLCNLGAKVWSLIGSSDQSHPKFLLMFT